MYLKGGPNSPVPKREEKQQINFEVETIENMKPSVMQLFVFIREQLMNPEHPLNKVSKCFVENYVEHYGREILMNVEKYHATQKNDFSITKDVESGIIDHHENPGVRESVEKVGNTIQVRKMSMASSSKKDYMDNTEDNMSEVIIKETE